jgi:N-acetylmuramoyl-L-alanine amidase
VLGAVVLCGAVAAPAAGPAGAAPDPGGLAPDVPTGAQRAAAAADTAAEDTAADDQPLSGHLVVIDPGHQRGNHNFPRKIARLVPAGGFRKACNTTGTSTDGGYPEATFAWQVARRLESRLEDLGATVRKSRSTDSEDDWGPCVDTRGRWGNDGPADLKISIHGDGSYAEDAHGFHVISPTDRKPWTHDIFEASRRLALATRSALDDEGFARATYVAGGDGLDLRSDLATLNLSDVPTIMVELGTMRDSGDAKVMRSAKGQKRYARALAAAVTAFTG